MLVQLGTGVTVNPDTFPPLRHISEVGPLYSQSFIGSSIIKYMSGAMVLQPDNKVCHLCPEKLWESRLDKKCMHMLNKSMVKQFCYAIVLWGIMGCKLMLHALLLKELGNNMASVLPSSIQVKVFDLDTFLGLSPCCK